MSDESRPLDALLRELPAVPEDVPREPVHARVLEIGGEEAPAYLLAVWSDPGSPLALHKALRRRVEGTFLADLCRTPAKMREPSSAPRAMHLVAFALPQGDVPAALRAFAFREVDATSLGMRDAVARARGEAYALDIPLPDDVAAAYTTDIVHAKAPELARLELALTDALAETHWGAKPGEYAAQLMRLCKLVGLGEITPTLEGLVRLEGLVCSREKGHVRMIAPITFQALCELVGVVATSALRRKVDFADCAPDEDGFAPPPLLRVSSEAGHVHVPVAQDLLRWLVMPLADGEQPPTLADWLTDRIGKA
jgi:hypothetical protein